MPTRDQATLGWTLVLRRQPARPAEGPAHDGYTNMFELVCCDCGDDPDLDYCDVSPELQWIRGPYPIAAGIAAYRKHLEMYPHHQPDRQLSSQHTVPAVGQAHSGRA